MKEKIKYNLIADKKCNSPLKIMKISILLSFLCLFSLAAENIHSQQLKLSLELKNVTIREAISEIEKTSDYVFLITDEARLELNKKTSLHAKKESIHAILGTILKNTDLRYKIVERQVSLYKIASANSVTDIEQVPVPTAKTMIRGVVVDSDQLPLPGVNIVLKSNKSTGTTSDANGNFALGVYFSENESLIFSFIGMKNKEVPLSSFRQGPVIVVLEADDKELGEVVVTGIFNKSRESYTGAAKTISTEELQEVGNRNILTSIRNIDPSFNILQDITLGSNPNALPSITIRGSSSLTSNVRDLQDDSKNLREANQPLFIMDGFEISLSRFMDLDENQIESFTLLKDNSATSLYGSRGANGVVVLTTKRPETGKLRITYRGNMNIEAPDLTSYNLMNAQEKLAFEKASGLYYGINAVQEQELLDLYNQRKIDAERGVDTYWLKYPVRTGVGHRHSLRLEGGNESILYAAGLSYNNISGAMKGSERNTFNGNVLLQYRITNFTFQNDLQVTNNKAIESPYGTFYDFAKVNAYHTPYDEDGNIRKVLEDFYYVNLNKRSFVYNPLYNALLPQRNDSKYQQVTNNFSAEWRIVPELFFRGRFSVSSTNSRSDQYISAKNTKFDQYSGEEFSRKGTYDYGTGNGSSYDADITLNYTNTFAKKHQLFAGLGYNIAEETSENYSISAEGISNINMDFLGMAGYYKKDGAPYGSESITRRVGGMASVNYTYDSRYFADFSGRVEGSSRFGADSRYAPFWSAGLGWNLHHESFLLENKAIDIARLRMSYGTSGSQNFSPYQAITTFKTNTESSYRNWYGVYLQGLGNRDLGWQTTYQLNIGAELEMFKRRIILNMDFYNKYTTDLLSDINMPSAGGFNTYRANVGNISNKGIEVTLNAYIIRDQTRGLSWSVGGSLIHNKNEIRKISNSLQFLNEELRQQSNVNPSFMFEEGQSINTIYAVKSKGIDPSNGKEIFIKADGTETYTWDPKDKVAVGVNEPKIFGNLTTTLRYKGFNFNAVFGYRYGGQMYNQTLVNMIENIYPYNNADKRAYYDRWKEPGDVVFFKSVKEYNSVTNATSRFVMDENTLECRTISLGYEVPSNWLKKQNLPVQYLSITGYGEDLFQVSSIKQERGLDYPYSRKFSMALTVRF